MTITVPVWLLWIGGALLTVVLLAGIALLVALAKFCFLLAKCVPRLRG